MTLILPNWPAPQNIKACTTTRDSWGNPHQSPKSESSTQALINLFHLPAKPKWIHQTHCNIAVEASQTELTETADASYTQKPNTVCIVLTADCLPILICNRQGTEVAALHAGWRGLANNIIENTVSALQSPPSDLLVWLGPAIGPKQFEVGKDVFDAFVSQDASTETAFIPHTANKWLANLYQLASLRLNKQGITHIFGGDYCTHTQKDLFYSYRRDNGKTGRMASLIWISK